MNDLSLHCNGNHLVVVSAVFSDQKSFVRDLLPLWKYYPDAKCYYGSLKNTGYFNLQYTADKVILGSFKIYFFVFICLFFCGETRVSSEKSQE